MRRSGYLLIPILILVLGAGPVRAASTPPINVGVFGLELCPQSICHAAIFAGLLAGRVGNNQNALGTFIAAVTHDEDLPEPGGVIAVTGGFFELRVGLRRFPGHIAPGTLLANPGNTFTVNTTLVFADGATAAVEINLDHTVFPPTVSGVLITN
jgi:hypothetical protein